MALSQQECEEFWNAADKNGDGKLTIQELAAAVRKWTPKSAKPPSTKDIAYMFSEVDKDGDNLITKAEFLSEMAKPPMSQVLPKLFKEMDTNGDGTLSRDEVAALVRKSGCAKGDVDKLIDEIIKNADTSGDGVISYDEFVNALQ